MIKFENTNVTGWDVAIRSIRNMTNSWERSDSFCSANDECHECSDRQKCGLYMSDRDNAPSYRNRNGECFHYIGPKDYYLMAYMSYDETGCRDFMKMISAQVDVTAPLYWWQEFDTYHTGDDRTLRSVIYRIRDKEFVQEDFSCDTLSLDKADTPVNGVNFLCMTIDILNRYRKDFLDTNEEVYLRQIISLLPLSYNHKRTVVLNYRVLSDIYKSSKSDKSNEWSTKFMTWIKNLPYSELITGEYTPCRNGDCDSCDNTDCQNTPDDFEDEE